MKSKYIDCDYIVYKDNVSGLMHHIICLDDYEATCNHGLWRDGAIGNALIKLHHSKDTDALSVYKDNKEILQITRDTSESEYTIV